MSAVTADMVRTLREMTGAGMMECKKALVECAGDFDKAVDFLRVKSGSKAERVSGRTAAEGRLAFSGTGGNGVLAEINCETDFVARDENFSEFCRHIATALAAAPGQSPATVTVGGDTGEQARQSLIMKVGENVSFGRALSLQAKGGIAHYTHTGDKIAAMIDYTGGEESLARDLCMHIAAMRPAYLNMEEVPPQDLAREREILTAQAAESGKPPAVVEKMIGGRLQKHFAEKVLLLQSFVKDGDKTAGEVLLAAGMTVYAFRWLVVGGGHA